MTCMKNQTTRVALPTAITRPIAACVAVGKGRNEARTVSAVKARSASKTTTMVAGETDFVRICYLVYRIYVARPSTDRIAVRRAPDDALTRPGLRLRSLS